MSQKYKKYLTSQQLSKQLGVSVSTIRKYCQHGILRFKKKSKNSYKLFMTESAKDDLALISRLKAMGCDLRHISFGRSMGIVNKSMLERAMSGLNRRRRHIRRKLRIADNFDPSFS